MLLETTFALLLMEMSMYMTMYINLFSVFKVWIHVSHTNLQMYHVHYGHVAGKLTHYLFFLIDFDGLDVTDKWATRFKKAQLSNY